MMPAATYWEIPKLWDGQACAIIAGGPSVTQADVDLVRASPLRVIAINNAYQLAPDADLLYFCDIRWYGWHKDKPEFGAFMARAQAGEALVCTLENQSLAETNPHIKSVRNSGRNGLETCPSAIRNGSNGGYQAINIALHLGVTSIVLLGYDMKPIDGKFHWHEEHPVKSAPSVYQSLMLPAYKSIVSPLKDAGVSVLNTSLSSALDIFEIVPIAEALKRVSHVGTY